MTGQYVCAFPSFFSTDTLATHFGQYERRALIHTGSRGHLCHREWFTGCPETVSTMSGLHGVQRSCVPLCLVHRVSTGLEHCEGFTQGSSTVWGSQHMVSVGHLCPMALAHSLRSFSSSLLLLPPLPAFKDFAACEVVKTKCGKVGQSTW